jgi:polysaccharide biosynthesis/export protein
MGIVLRTSFGALGLGVVCLGSLLLFAACSISTPSENAASKDSGASQPAAGVDSYQRPAGLDAGQSDTDALEKLWRSRVAERPSATPSSDFTIGPGDILRISMPQIEQLKERTVRVSENDTIDLPLLGSIKVTGMSQRNLQDELARRLEKYVYRPEVAVYLEHSENRLVAVVGAVKAPGRYMLASRLDTITTMISRAGGTTENAASRIILIPASSTNGTLPVVASQERAFELAGETTSGVSHASERAIAEPDPIAVQATAEGVTINLFHSVNQRFLEIPVKSGDEIIVPVAGEVTVQGWVQNPGAFKITPGMTVLSSVAAAGGALFSSSATLLREQANSSRLILSLNLSQLKTGAEPDVPLQSGDVVVVERSAAGAIPYSLYFLLNKLGWGIPLPI